MNKLFIHIGTHKTGSTAIQSWLRSNYAYLKTKDIFYISKFHNYRKQIKIQDENVKKRIIIELRDLFNRNIGGKKGKTFIISSEYLSGDPKYGYIDSLAITRTMKEITSGLNLQIFIIVYLRRQDDFFESYYTEMIRAGWGYDFDIFLINMGPMTSTGTIYSIITPVYLVKKI